MPQRTLLITDFFSQCRSTTVSNAALFEKPMKVIEIAEESTSQHAFLQTDFDQTSPLQEINQSEEQRFDVSPSKSSIPSRIKFVRHHSAPLHHRSPVKMRERPLEQQDLEEIRTRIRAFRSDLYKYKSNYSRSPIKRLNSTGADPITSPFKVPAPQTPVKR